MTWFKVDDTLAFHRKAVVAGNAAMGLWVRAGSWCSQQLTDGFVPDDMIASLGNSGQAKRLVTAGLWERVDGGYRFWQWDERQPSREQVEQERNAARERMRRVRTGRRSSPEQNTERSGEHTENERRSSDGVRLPRPVPSRPEGTGGSVGESSSRRNAQGPDDDDRVSQTIIDVLRTETGQTVTTEWADKVRRQILAGRTVSDPVRYVAACIRGGPRDYLPTGSGDPASRSVAEALAAARGEA